MMTEELHSRGIPELDPRLCLHCSGPSMVVFIGHSGTPVWTPKFFNPHDWRPQNGTPNLGKNPYFPYLSDSRVERS